MTQARGRKPPANAAGSDPPPLVDNCVSEVLCPRTSSPLRLRILCLHSPRRAPTQDDSSYYKYLARPATTDSTHAHTREHENTHQMNIPFCFVSTVHSLVLFLLAPSLAPAEIGTES